jgi:hypothetical protein
VCIQLRRDLQKMPMEDPSIEWPEDLPMRARFQACKASAEFRHSANGRKMVEPRSIGELPA